MKILAINSAFTESNIVYFDGKKVNRLTLDSSLRHSENLLPAVEKLLGDETVNDIDYLAVVVGPGSFTGIRIGVAMAKAFMTSCSKIKAISINSLELLARGYIKEQKPVENFWCVLNALSGNFFTAQFAPDGKCLQQPCMVSGEKLEEISKQNVLSLTSENLEFSTHQTNFDCDTLFEVAKAKIDAGEFVSESQLLPLYLRLSQAEQELKERENAD